MREIKFRAKRVDNGEWVYGDLRQYVNNGIFPDFYTIDTMSTKPNGIGTNHTVLEETVGQYTGLCDKNDKEIYEGDIVHCWDTIAKCEIWAVVEFGNPNAEYTWGWQLRKIKGSKGVNLDILCWVECEETNAYCEIIGNIYDNPELLKGE